MQHSATYWNILNQEENGGNIQANIDVNTSWHQSPILVVPSSHPAEGQCPLPPQMAVVLKWIHASTSRFEDGIG